MQVDNLLIITLHVKRPDNDHISAGLHQSKYLNGAVEDAKKIARHYGHDPDRRWSLDSIGSFFSGFSDTRKTPKVLIKHFWYGTGNATEDALGKNGERLGQYLRVFPETDIERNRQGKITKIKRFPVNEQDQQQIARFMGDSPNVGVYFFFHYVKSQDLVSNAANIEAAGEFATALGLNQARKMACMACDVGRSSNKKGIKEVALRFANAIRPTLTGHRPVIATYSHAMELDADGHKLFDKDHGGNVMLRRSDMPSDPLVVLAPTPTEYQETGRAQWTDKAPTQEASLTGALSEEQSAVEELQQQKQAIENNLNRYLVSLTRYLRIMNELPHPASHAAQEVTQISQTTKTLEANIKDINQRLLAVSKADIGHQEQFQELLSITADFLKDRKEHLQELRQVVADLKYWGELETAKQRMNNQLDRLGSVKSLGSSNIDAWQQLRDQIRANREELQKITERVSSIRFGSKTSELAQDEAIRLFRSRLNVSLDYNDRRVDELLNKMLAPPSNVPSERSSAFSSARASMRSVNIQEAGGPSTPTAPHAIEVTPPSQLAIWNSGTKHVSTADKIVSAPNTIRHSLGSLFGREFEQADTDIINQKLARAGEHNGFVSSQISDSDLAKGIPMHAKNNGDLFLWLPTSPGSRPRIGKVTSKRHGRTAEAAIALVAEVDDAIQHGTDPRSETLYVEFKALSKAQQSRRRR